MAAWIKNNKITALCVALIPIIAIGSFIGNFSERFFIRPYMQAQADTVYVKKSEPCINAINDRIDKIESKNIQRDEFIIKTYYYNKASLTKKEIEKANDDMTNDTALSKFLSTN